MDCEKRGIKNPGPIASLSDLSATLAFCPAFDRLHELACNPLLLVSCWPTQRSDASIPLASPQFARAIGSSAHSSFVPLGETGKTCLPRRPTRNGRRLAALPEVIDTSVAFVGWNGEIPILRQEEGLSDGSTRTSFQSLNPDGSLTNLDPKSWQGIQKGSPVEESAGIARRDHSC